MRILIVDDSQARANEFRKRYPKSDLTIVKTYSEALRRLRMGPKYDLVHLDYDLADEEPDNIQLSGRKRTGLDVAYAMCGLAHTPLEPTRVIVHTHNAQRGPVMVDALEQAHIRTEYQPF